MNRIAAYVLFAFIGVTYCPKVAAKDNVEVFVLPRSVIVPQSGHIWFDIYIRNLNDRSVLVAAPSQYRASYRLVDSRGHRFDRFFGSTGGSPHRDPPLSVAPHSVVHTKFEMRVAAENGDLVEIEFIFGNQPHAKTASVILARGRRQAPRN
jgi:hypothetical protein